MNFLLRGALLSSAAFFLIYIILSLTLATVWPLFRAPAAASGANRLFALRVLPMMLALFGTLVFVIPSFLYLEPNGTGEVVGYLGIALACGGMFVAVFGPTSALLASWKTSQFVR